MMSSPRKAMSSEPRYTIEQISLLHRLLRTGLTKQDIVHALDSMTKMDAELQASNLPLTGGLTGVSSSSYSSSGKTPGQVSMVAPSVNTDMQRGTGAVVEAGDSGMMQGTSAGILQGMSQEVMCGVENFQNVSDEDVDNLFRRGPMAIKSEIRTFLNKHKLSQNQISMATGISQSYISSFLIHGFMMKRSTQELLYRWYLGKRREMEDSGKSNQNMQPDLEHHNVSLPVRSIDLSQSYHCHNGDNFLPSFKRRERFTWKDSHVRILESYYSKNPYPNDFEREKITEACNNEYHQSGETISDSKWVTSSKVYNWFANRRKDSNRRKRLNQRLETDGTVGLEDTSVDHSDHTHYASTSPQNVHVIEVHQDGDHQDVDDLSGPEVHVVELHVDSEQPESNEQKVQSSISDTKTYGGVNTIYTLIEAVKESDMTKNSQ